MRLHIDNKGAQNSIGFFFNALEEHLKKMRGVYLVSPAQSEIILCGPTSSIAAKWLGRKRIVQRLDGVYFNSDDATKSLSKNLEIKNIYTRANGIIFQSKYSKNMVESILGPCSLTNATILNGCELTNKYIAKAPHLFPQIASLKNDGYTIIFAAAAWRPVKRMKPVLEGFAEYRKTHPKTVLVLAGEGVQANQDGVISLGKVEHNKMLGLYSLIDLLVNLSFSDACPNVVVEALGAKKPILATSNQGSSELYGGNGYIIPEPFQWDFKFISYHRMPMISPQLVASGIEKALSTGYKNDIDVSMATCATNYKKFLEMFKQKEWRA